MVSICAEDWKLEDVAGVIFDKDGTLIDSHAYWGEIIRRRAAALASRLGGGPGLEPALVRTMGYDGGLGRLLPEGPIALKSRDEVIKAVLACLGKAGLGMSGEEVGAVFSSVHSEFAGGMAAFVKALPGAAGLLRSLKAGNIPCALVTSDSAAASEAILRQLGLAEFFPVVLGRESSPEPKESGKPGLAAAGLLGLPPDRVVCVGDAPMDVLMAERAGLKAAVAVATGQVPLADLRRLTPYTVNALTDLKVGD